MMRIVALKAFSDGTLSMYQGEIRDIDDDKAEQYISEGYVEEYSGGGSVETGSFTVINNTGAGVNSIKFPAYYEDDNIFAPADGNVLTGQTGEFSSVLFPCYIYFSSGTVSYTGYEDYVTYDEEIDAYIVSQTGVTFTLS